MFLHALGKTKDLRRLGTHAQINACIYGAPDLDHSFFDGHSGTSANGGVYLRCSPASRGGGLPTLGGLKVQFVGPDGGTIDLGKL